MRDEYEDDIRFMRLSDEETDEDEITDYEEVEEMEDPEYDELDFDRTERNMERLRNRWRNNSLLSSQNNIL